MPGPFDAVIFDNDGLLLDTEEAWTRAEEDLFERHGSLFSAEHKRSLLGNSQAVAGRKLADWLGMQGEEERLWLELEELVMEEALNGVPVRPGAVELLDTLHARGQSVGLASNSTRAFVERVLDVAGLPATRFEALVTVDDVTRPKPAPDLYLEACERLGAAPDRSAALEDSPPGVASARAAGLFVIAIPYFADHTIDGASLIAPSLADPAVAAALGL